MYGDVIRIIILAIVTCVLVFAFEYNKESDNSGFCFVFGIGALIAFVTTAAYVVMFIIHLLQVLNKIW